MVLTPAQPQDITKTIDASLGIFLTAANATAVDAAISANAGGLENQTTEHQILIKMLTGMFNAAPGKEILAELSQMVANGMSWDAMATYMGNTSQFQEMYSPSLSHAAFATRYLGSIIPGYDATSAAHGDAHNLMVSWLDSGMPAGQVILEALVALHDVSATDPIWGVTRQQWENRSEVASYYSLDKAQSTDFFATMQNVVKGVYADADSLATVISRIDEIAATGKFTLSGSVAQVGYLSGATVFLDTNGDGKLNPGEISTTTDAKGHFTLQGGDFGTLVATGGTDITTRLAFTGVMTATAASTVINPLTTLQQAFVAKGYSVDEAEARIGKALGIDVGKIDLSTYNPLAVAFNVNASITDRAFAASVQVQATKVLNLITAGAGMLVGGAGGAARFSEAQAMDALFQSLVSAIEKAADSVVSLSNTPFIKNVVAGSIAAAGDADLTAAATKVGAMTDSFATMLADSAGNIDTILARETDATMALGRVGQVASLAQGVLADRIQAAAAGGSLDTLVFSFTGATAEAAAKAIQIGNLDPNSTLDSATIRVINGFGDTGGLSLIHI